MLLSRLSFILFFAWFLTCTYSLAFAVTDFEHISQEVIERLGYDTNTKINFRLNSSKKAQLEKESLELIEVKKAEGNSSDLLTLTLVDVITNKEHRIQATVENLSNALAPIKDINRGDEVTRDDLIIIKVGKNNNNYLQDFPAIGEIKVAKSKLLANKPIKNDDLIVPVLVQKGQKVKVIFHKHNLTIETSGLCLEAGSLNDIIKVKILDNDKIFQGSVVNNEVVMVVAK